MARRICLADEKKRDAEIEIVPPLRAEGWQYVGPAGEEVSYEKFIKGTEAHIFEALIEEYDGDAQALGEALIEEDPEFDRELLGRRVGEADRVWLKADGTVLYSTRILQVLETPDGERKEQEFEEVEATVGEGITLPWSGRLFAIEDVIRRFVLSRKLQLRHVNGLTYDFLYEMARKLHESERMLLVGSGPKGVAPLIFQANGSPYRGFLQGRVDGEGFLLVLHLSNLELKGVKR